jgi:flagellin
MSLFINTNINSLNAQRNLTKSQSDVSQALQRLSSGLRINSAKDDAAGLAIATRFTTQINGLNQAVRNANDGVSLAQTTGSALSEVTNNLQRIRTLAVESTNATNSASDRSALDQEVQQRISEISRIANQTTFNGLKVLDGSFGQATFQVGANVGDTIDVNLSTGIGATQIGSIATTGALDLSSAFETDATPASVETTGLTSTDFSTDNASFNVDSNAVSLNTSYDTVDDVVDAIQSQLDGEAADTYSVSNDGGQIKIATTATGAGESIAIGNATGITFGSPVDGADSGDASLTLNAGDLAIQVGDGDATDITGTFSNVDELNSAINKAGIAGLSSYVDSDNALHLSSSDALAVTGDQASTLGFDASYDVKGSMSGTDVLNVADANNTISRVDAALEAVSGLDSKLGAIQNRFESTISNLQAVSQNLSSARSRIQDADFAKETAALTRGQILQNAGISVLSQANAAPQSVLKLLQ